MVQETGVHTNDSKMVLNASLLNTQQYNILIKGKLSNPGKRVTPSPTLRCNSSWKERLWSPSSTVGSLASQKYLKPFKCMQRKNELRSVYKFYEQNVYEQNIYLIYMYEEDLALNNLQWFICHKTKPEDWRNFTRAAITSTIRKHHVGLKPWIPWPYSKP